MGSSDAFDPTPYLNVPLLTIEASLALGRALLAASPSRPPKQVANAKSRLLAALDAAERAVAHQRRAEELGGATDPMAIDAATDALWTGLRDRLASWLVFEHEEIVAASPAGARLERRATKARELLNTLFGKEGLAFLKRSYPEQSETMRTILRTIKSEAVQKDLRDLAGSEFVDALFAIQDEYESMVAKYLARREAKNDDVRELRTQVQRAIVNYNTTILALFDPEDPTTLEAVQGSLRAVEDLQTRLGRGFTHPGAHRSGN